MNPLVRFHVSDVATGHPVDQVHIEAKITDHALWGSSQFFYVNNTDGAGNSDAPDQFGHGYDVDYNLTRDGYFDIHNSAAGVSPGATINSGMKAKPPVPVVTKDPVGAVTHTIEDPFGLKGAPTGQGGAASLEGKTSQTLGGLEEALKEIGTTAAIVIGVVSIAVILIVVLILIYGGGKVGG